MVHTIQLRFFISLLDDFDLKVDAYWAPIFLEASFACTSPRNNGWVRAAKTRHSLFFYHLIIIFFFHEFEVDCKQLEISWWKGQSSGTSL